MNLFINKISEFLFLFVIFNLEISDYYYAFFLKHVPFPEQSLSSQWLEIWVLFSLLLQLLPERFDSLWCQT